MGDSDILSQGRERGPGPWARRVAVLGVLALVAALVAWHLPHHSPVARHPPVKAAPPLAAATVAPWPGLTPGPNGVSGLAMPREGSLRLPLAGQQPAWLWPATGRVQPIGGLPRDESGYQFTRAAGGWAVWASPAARPGCGTCAGRRAPVYFLADHAQSAALAGLADEVAPAADAGSLWLTSYPPGADTRTAAGTAQEASGASRPAGPGLTLPPGYTIDQETERGFLLSPVAPSGAASYLLWNPAAPHPAVRTFTGVLAASATQVAWATRCDPACHVEILSLATGQRTQVSLPRASSAVNGAFSPDGKFLALQLSFTNVGDDGALAMQLEVASTTTGQAQPMPAVRVSSDALTGFGWPAASDDLVAELNFLTKLQVAAWRPGTRRPSVAVITPGPESASLIVG